MGFCEHRYLADVFKSADIEVIDGRNVVKQDAKPDHRECQECGAEVPA